MVGKFFPNQPYFNPLPSASPPQKFFLKKIKKKWSAAATNKIDTLDVDSLKMDFF
jgi:hypothetical protein